MASSEALRTLLNLKDMLCCSMRFEPFGGLKSAFKMANESSDANTRLEMTEVYRRSSIVEHDPDYETPALQDIEIICIAFDVLHNGKEVSTF